MLTIVLDNLEAGLSAEEIIHDYPSLTPDDIDAVRAYAVELARQGSVEIRRVGRD